MKLPAVPTSPLIELKVRQHWRGRRWYIPLVIALGMALLGATTDYIATARERAQRAQWARPANVYTPAVQPQMDVPNLHTWLTVAGNVWLAGSMVFAAGLVAVSASRDRREGYVAQYTLTHLGPTAVMCGYILGPILPLFAGQVVWAVLVLFRIGPVPVLPLSARLTNIALMPVTLIWAGSVGMLVAAPSHSPVRASIWSAVTTAAAAVFGSFAVQETLAAPFFLHLQELRELRAYSASIMLAQLLLVHCLVRIGMQSEDEMRTAKHDLI